MKRLIFIVLLIPSLVFAQNIKVNKVEAKKLSLNTYLVDSITDTIMAPFESDKLVSEKAIRNYVTSTIPISSWVIDHNALNNVQQAASGITYGHITDQAQTISGTKTFSSDVVINGNEAIGTTADATRALHISKTHNATPDVHAIHTTITKSVGSTTTRVAGMRIEANYSGIQEEGFTLGVNAFASNIGTGYAKYIYGLSGQAFNTSTGTSQWVIGSNNYATLSGTGAVTYAYGTHSLAQNSSSASVNDLGGANNKALNISSGVVQYGYGSYNYIKNETLGTISRASIIEADMENKGIMTNLYGLFVGGWINTGTITNAYGIYIDNTTNTGINKYAIYSASLSDSYLLGRLIVNNSGGISSTGDFHIGQNAQINPWLYFYDNSSQKGGIFYNNSINHLGLANLTNQTFLFLGSGLSGLIYTVNDEDHTVWHSANSNLSSVDWQTKDLTVYGTPIAPNLLSSGITNPKHLTTKEYVDNAVVGGLNYLGAWNANTNTPTISDATGSNGNCYIVQVAGTRDLGSGSISFTVGGWVIHNGSVWQFTGTASEIDPVWTAAIGNYYTKTNMQTSGTAQLHYNNLINKPTTVAGFGISDAMTTAHAANAITSTNISNWNTAYGWGNHSGLYRPIGYVPAWSEITSNPFVFSSVVNNQLIKYNSTSGKWENWTPNYLTSYTETDPLFSSWNKSTGISITSSQITDYQSSGDARYLQLTSRELKKAWIALGTSGAVSWDMNQGYNASIAITGNVTLTINNSQDGDYGTLYIDCAATAYTITITSGAFPGVASNNIFTTSANNDAENIISFVRKGTKFYFSSGANYVNPI